MDQGLGACFSTWRRMDATIQTKGFALKSLEMWIIACMVRGCWLALGLSDLVFLHEPSALGEKVYLI
jgi:hypothetical protein